MRKVAIIYTIICMIRTIILFRLSLLPVWIIVVWGLISLVVLSITALIIKSKEVEK